MTSRGQPRPHCGVGVEWVKHWPLISRLPGSPPEAGLRGGLSFGLHPESCLRERRVECSAHLSKEVDLLSVKFLQLQSKLTLVRCSKGEGRGGKGSLTPFAIGKWMATLARNSFDKRPCNSEISIRSDAVSRRSVREKGSSGERGAVLVWAAAASASASATDSSAAAEEE